MISSIVKRVKAHNDYKRLYNQLSSLTNRELDDIGLRRSDIERVARGIAA